MREVPLSRLSAAVKRETGARPRTQCLCCPRNGKRVWTRRHATGFMAWEGGASGLASPDTGLCAMVEVPRGEVCAACGPTVGPDVRLFLFVCFH